MAKRKKKSDGTVTGNVPSTFTPYDPTSNYGRTKEKPYLNTSAGHHAIDQDPTGYLGYVARRAGVDTSGATGDPFGSYLKNNAFAGIKSSYDAAVNSNPELSFAHYAQSQGIPGDQAALTGGNVLNTGNVYTSSSGVVDVPKVKNKKKEDKFQNLMPGITQAPNLDQWMAQMRHNYSKLTPQQQGTSGPGYARGPAGWSVY